MTPRTVTQLKILFGVLACVLVLWARFAYLYNLPGQSPTLVVKPGWFGSVAIDAIEDEGSFYSAESRTVIHQYRPVSWIAVLGLLAVVYVAVAEILVPTILGRPPPVGMPGRRR